MDYTEKDIEEELMDYPGLIDQLKINPIGNQVVVEHGIIDILAYDPSDKYLVVIELKKGLVDESAVGQIMRYMADISELKKWIDNNAELAEEIKNIQGVKGILMGSNASPGVEAIIDTFPFIKFYQIIVRLNVEIVPEFITRIEHADPSPQITIDSFMGLEPYQQIIYSHTKILKDCTAE